MRGKLIVAAAMTCAIAWGQPRSLIEWRFDAGLEGWRAANHVEGLRADDGAMIGRATDWDPFVTSPQFEIAATPWQVVELRLRSRIGGMAEIFWTNTTQTQYEGFSPGKETAFEVTGDGQWHTYRIQPWWHAEERIILLRLDLPRTEPADPYEFAVDYIRVVDPGAPAAVPGDGDWRLPAEGWETEGGRLEARGLRVPLDGRPWLALELSGGGGSGLIQWVSWEHNGLHSRSFTIEGNGEPRVHNVQMSGSRQWSGDLLMLAVTVPPGATVRRIAIAEEPVGPPQVEVRFAGPTNAINRSRQQIPFTIHLTNRGGEAAETLRIARIELPEGVAVVERDGWRELPPVDPFTPASHEFILRASRPVEGVVRIVLDGPGAPATAIEAPIRITQALSLPPAEYVPEPRPVRSEYEIGAYYFPGWATRARWEPVRRNAPQRKPVLGWYDEGNPEVADWQIKWAVEHGISFFMVDWYWNAGSTHLMHWLEHAYMNARYRSYLKFCLMWANHNPPGSHSEDDQRAVTRYWLEHYFGMDEYYTIDGKPVVIIWSPGRMRQDMGSSEGVRRLLEISQQMAREAGYPGICFVAMKFPEASTDPALIGGFANEGFEMTTIYHYIGHGGAAEDPRHYPFELVAESTLPFLRARREANIIPFFPAISTGWDSRPWHGDRATVVHGRTVPLFRRICEDVRTFADESGLRRIAVGPLNEWGEGSYIEPNREFGFGMYDALRETFCDEPPGGWPPNIAPQDVGLGPYDLPEPEARSVWDFADGPQGWSPLMGVSNLRAEGGALQFETTSADPAITCALPDVRAADVAEVHIRMSLDGDGGTERAQLFWSTSTQEVSEGTSVRFDVVRDGEYHDYVLRVAESDRWRGLITAFRFDPCSRPEATVRIDDIRLVSAP